MQWLNRLFEQYNGVIRRFKGVYVVHNILNYKKLKANKGKYKEAGVQKKVWEPIGKKDFKNSALKSAWLDQEGALDALQSHPDYDSFTSEEQEAMMHFVQEGYLILPQFFKPEQVKAMNTEMEEMLSRGDVQYNYSGRKIMDAFQQSDLVDKQFFRHPRLLKLLSFLLGREAQPFQTIHFFEGSEQRAHSDSFHMTTEPEGYLIAAWIALEDIQVDSGPLFYYPGSHRLPFVSYEQFSAGNTALWLGKDYNHKYEEAIARVIEKGKLEKKHFLAKAGDVLIWHANLLHGGEKMARPGASRKSMVAHYFGDGAICYHEITQRPAILG